MFDLSKIPDSVKLEVSKEDLLAFAQKLQEQESTKHNSPPIKEILSIDEAATFINLARQTLYSLCSKRAIPFYKRNKRLYFKRSELLSWIEEGKKKTQVEFDDELADYIKRNKKK